MWSSHCVKNRIELPLLITGRPDEDKIAIVKPRPCVHKWLTPPESKSSRRWRIDEDVKAGKAQQNCSAHMWSHALSYGYSENIYTLQYPDDVNYYCNYNVTLQAKLLPGGPAPL